MLLCVLQVSQARQTRRTLQIIRLLKSRRLTSIPRDQSQHVQAEDNTQKVLLDLCRKRGFIFGDELTSTSVLRGCQNLGPLGTRLKKNLLDEWWSTMVLNRDQVLPIDTLHHLPGSSSPSAKLSLKICPQSGPGKNQDLTTHKLDEDFGKMFDLRQDLLEGTLRCYPACLELLSKRLPFGIAEVGRCFHPVMDEEESMPFRLGERTVASLAWFTSGKTSGQWQDYWLRHRLVWWQRFSQVPSRFSISDQQDDGGRKMSIINYHFPWGEQAVEILTSLNDSALTQVHGGSSSSLHARDGRKSVIPHVVWVSSDVERGLLAYLCDALQVTGNSTARSTDQRRTVLKLHPSLAPIKVSVDVGKGPTADLRLVCQGLSTELREVGISIWPGYQDTLYTPMEQLFTKYDEMGVLFTVLISDVTLESGLLQLRSRDTTIKETMHISKLRAFLSQYMTAAKKL
ncbi:DNA polymerase subunit gamma-2 [Hyperolius riggenbachi]|uniref:DNA polymerase subunit gamma-2 n=1 Tax=Hyperolius riggenbachi TaxID=752182 RepID=UPI0035A2C489